jgi:hypothetical protein
LKKKKTENNKKGFFAENKRKKEKIISQFPAEKASFNFASQSQSFIRQSQISIKNKRKRQKGNRAALPSKSIFENKFT